MELKELREQPVELMPNREALGHFSLKLTFASVNAYNKAVAANAFRFLKAHIPAMNCARPP